MGLMKKGLIGLGLMLVVVGISIFFSSPKNDAGTIVTWSVAGLFLTSVGTILIIIGLIIPYSTETNSY